ncbi:MAG TPA: terminase small subunit [Rummeliibacillus sp.]|nr:terminase small subunit [Rummeliibacillus sp.]
MREDKSLNRPLTHKQKAFVDNYTRNGFNGSKAARDAGYNGDNQRVLASQNLSKLNVAQEVANRMAAAAEKAGWNPEYVFSRLMEISKDISAGNCLRAIEQATRYSGMSKDEVNVNVRRHEDWLDMVIDKENIIEHES